MSVCIYQNRHGLYQSKNKSTELSVLSNPFSQQKLTGWLIVSEYFFFSTHTRSHTCNVHVHWDMRFNERSFILLELRGRRNLWKNKVVKLFNTWSYILSHISCNGRWLLKNVCPSFEWPSRPLHHNWYLT